MKIALFLFGMLAYSGCSKTQLPDYFRLGPLRILTIYAPNPELALAGGAPGVLTAVINDLDASGRTLSYSWIGCNDPGVAIGAAPTCNGGTNIDPGGSGSITPTSGNGFSAVVNFTPQAINGALVTALYGNQPMTLFNGVAYLYVFTLRAPDGTTQTAFRRILLSGRPTKNQNPTLLAILDKNSGALTAPIPNVDGSWTPSIGPGSAESYPVQLADGSAEIHEEHLTVTWFVSLGGMENTRTDGTSSNLYHSDDRNRGTTQLIPVLRDDHGGVGLVNLAQPWIGP